MIKKPDNYKDPVADQIPQGLDWERLESQDPDQDLDDPDWLTSMELTNATARPFPRFIVVSYSKGEVSYTLWLNLSRIESVIDFGERVNVKLVNGLSYSLDAVSRARLLTVLGSVAYGC